MSAGNPILDISVKTNVDYLKKYDLEENIAILAEDKHMEIYNEIAQMNPIYLPGGATQNSINVAQWVLGIPNATSYMGCIKDDENGKTLAKACKDRGVTTHYYYNKDSEPTGLCACLITNENRTLVTNLAAANKFVVDHLEEENNWSVVMRSKVFYSAGFFLTVSPDSLLKVAKYYDTCPDKILCVNLSAPFISQFFMEPLMQIMPYVDILFGNETEAAAFAKAQNFDEDGGDLQKIAEKIRQLPYCRQGKLSRTVVITQGSQPVIVASKEQGIKLYDTPQMDASKIVDTNGAGDAFVGGFLAQLVLDRGIDEAVRCGIWTAQQIIQQSGCTFPPTCDFK